MKASPVPMKRVEILTRPGILWILATMFIPAGALAESSPAEDDPLVGTYRFAGGDEERRAVAEAIDQVVDELNVFIRGIARRRLRESNLPSEQLRICLRDDDIGVLRTGQPDIYAPTNGDPTQWRSPRTGNELRISHEIDRQGALEQRLEGDRGLSRNRFTLSDDGRTILMHTVVESERLPRAIRFETTYERTSAGCKP